MNSCEAALPCRKANFLGTERSTGPLEAGFVTCTELHGAMKTHPLVKRGQNTALGQVSNTVQFPMHQVHQTPVPGMSTKLFEKSSPKLLKSALFHALPITTDLHI